MKTIQSSGMISCFATKCFLNSSLKYVGFRGQACQEEVNLCDRRPCLNNGTCKGNQTTYWCECPPGFSGKHCDANVNECLSSPCVHGVCEEGLNGYKCYCLPGIRYCFYLPSISSIYAYNP